MKNKKKYGIVGLKIAVLSIEKRGTFLGQGFGCSAVYDIRKSRYAMWFQDVAYEFENLKSGAKASFTE